MIVTRVAKSFGRLIFDPKFTETVTNTLKNSKKINGYSKFGTQVKDAFIAAENKTKNTPFWKNLWKSIKTLPEDISKSCANAKGFSNKTKGIFGQLGKRATAIFGAITVAFELPNLFSSFKDEGLVGGLLETIKSTGRVASQFAGFAIGQAIIPIPIIGGLVGAFASEFLYSTLAGKSHLEKKRELEDINKAAEQQYQDTLKQMQKSQKNTPYGNTNQLAGNITIPKATMTPQQVMQLGQALYGGGMTNPMDQDFMSMTSGMNRLNLMG